MGGPGVQRSLKFAKYLPVYDWNPVVLTVKNIEYLAYDNSLLDEIRDIETYRTGSFDPMRFLFLLEKIRKTRHKRIYDQTRESIKSVFRDIFPIDSKIGWIPFAVKKGKMIFSIQKIAAVYATIGPYSNAMVGYKLAKRYKKPLIIDYRDLWTGKPDINYFSKLHKNLSISWERRILAFADKIIVNTKSTGEKIKMLFPEIDREKFSVIYNGWDKEEFSNIKHRVISEKKIIFTFTGGFYGDQTPQYFLAAITELTDRQKLPENLEIRFVGNYFNDVLAVFSKYKNLDFIKIIPQVSHRESISYQRESDFLLLFIAEKNSEMIVPQKMFEYFANKKPLLAMIPENGEAAQLIRENKAGLISEINDIEKMKTNILKLIEMYHKGTFRNEFYTKEENFLNYERKAQTQHLAEILDSIT